MSYSEKKLSFVFLAIICLALFLLLSLFGTLYVVDPLHIYRLPSKQPILFSSNQRLQNAAFIRHYQFDSVILGNSHMENIRASEAKEKLGGDFFNLSLSGSNNFERAIILRDVFRRHNIKNVILLLTDKILRSGHGGYPISEWDFLYDDDPNNDFKVYINSNSPKLLQDALFKKKDNIQLDLDRPYAWINDPRIGGVKVTLLRPGFLS